MALVRGVRFTDVGGEEEAREDGEETVGEWRGGSCCMVGGEEWRTITFEPSLFERGPCDICHALPPPAQSAAVAVPSIQDIGPL